MKKIIILLLGICSLLFIALSCGDNKAKLELKKIAAELNSQCPVQYDFATCVGARIEDGSIVFDYVYDDEQMQLDYLNNNTADLKRQYGALILNADESMSDLLYRAGYGFTANYKGSKTGKTTTFHMTNDEIKRIKEHPATKSELLNCKIQITNMSLPMRVDEFTELAFMNCRDAYVSCVYEIDDEQVSMPLLEENRGEIKENLKQELGFEINSPTSDTKQMLTLVCRTNRAFRCVYRGKTTGKDVVVELSNADLRNLLNDYIEEE